MKREKTIKLKMKNLKEKYFFKQLGQFLGGLYNIALNREKLTGLKGFREKFKSSDKGIKGVKTYIDKFLKLTARSEQSFQSLRSLIEFIKGEMKRQNSGLSNLGKNQFNEIYEKTPGESGYLTLCAAQVYTLNPIQKQMSFTDTFDCGWNPFPKKEVLNTLELNKNYVEEYQKNV